MMVVETYQKYRKKKALLKIQTWEMEKSKDDPDSTGIQQEFSIHEMFQECLQYMTKKLLLL